jgi:hypothetical protein
LYLTANCWCFKYIGVPLKRRNLKLKDVFLAQGVMKGTGLVSKEEGTFNNASITFHFQKDAEK